MQKSKSAFISRNIESIRFKLTIRIHNLYHFQDFSSTSRNNLKMFAFQSSQRPKNKKKLQKILLSWNCKRSGRSKEMTPSSLKKNFSKVPNSIINWVSGNAVVIFPTSSRSSRQLRKELEKLSKNLGWRW